MLQGLPLRGDHDDCAPVVVYACRLVRALAARLGPTRARAPLPGTVVLGVPCVGVLHPDTIRGALDAGARGVYIAACVPEDCHFREGATWLAQRLTGERLPKLAGVPAARLRVGWYSPVEVGRFERELRAFRDGRDASGTLPVRRPGPGRIAGFTGLLAAVAVGLGAFASWPWAAAAPGAARLRVAVRHVAGVTASSQGPSAEDLERLPRHMRPPGGAAGLARGPRADTRLTVVVDGRPVLARTYRPTGFGHDGPTYVYKELPLAPGPHRIEVRLGEADGPGRGG